MDEEPVEQPEDNEEGDEQEPEQEEQGGNDESNEQNEEAEAEAEAETEAEEEGEDRGDVDEPEEEEEAPMRRSSVYSGSLWKRTCDPFDMRCAKAHGDKGEDPALVLEDYVAGWLIKNIAQTALADKNFLNSLAHSSTAPRIDIPISMKAVDDGIANDALKNPYARMFFNHRHQLSQVTKIQTMEGMDFFD